MKSSIVHPLPNQQNHCPLKKLYMHLWEYTPVIIFRILFRALQHPDIVKHLKMGILDTLILLLSLNNCKWHTNECSKYKINYFERCMSACWFTGFCKIFLICFLQVFHPSATVLELLTFPSIFFLFLFFSFFFFFFFFFFLFRAVPVHAKVPRLQVRLELQLPLAWTTATAMPDLTHICDLCSHLWQHWILNSLNKARD